MLPLIPVIVAAVAGATGLVTHGIKKMKDSRKRQTDLSESDANNTKILDDAIQQTCKVADKLGKDEVVILDRLNEFIYLFEKIHNRPSFREVQINDIDITYPPLDNIREVAEKATTRLKELTGATLGLGTAGGFAAVGATTAVTMVVGTASTGTAISALSGAAATNAMLAALGGGSLAAGGGGMALGSALLGASSAGIGLLIGAIIFEITNNVYEKKVDKIEEQVHKNAERTNKVCTFLTELRMVAEKYDEVLTQLHSLYDKQIDKMKEVISRGTNWEMFTNADQLIINNMVLLVGAIYGMCKVPLVRKVASEDVPNEVNAIALNQAQQVAIATIAKF